MQNQGELDMSTTLALLVKEDFLQIGSDFLTSLNQNPSSVNVAAQSLLAIDKIAVLPTEVVAQAQPLVQGWFALAAQHLQLALAQTQAQIAAPTVTTQVAALTTTQVAAIVP
jgi:hypothetical protein